MNKKSVLQSILSMLQQRSSDKEQMTGQEYDKGKKGQRVGKE